MRDSPRRVGVIGLGAIARYYLRAIDELPGWRLTAVCDPQPAAMEPYRDRARCYRDHRTMLRDAALDAAVVAVPNDIHAEVCRTALRAGVAVCVEKPLAASLEAGRELGRLSRATGTPLFTAFHRRYNDNVRRLLTTARAHGPPVSMTVRYLERIEEHIGTDTWYLDPRRCGGGCVADNGPNAFDLVRLFPGEVEVVSAAVDRDRDGTDRRAVVQLRSEHTAEATVELDWSYPGEAKDIKVLLAGGERMRADMLAGHVGFKSSLWHEYVGILDDFATAIEHHGRSRDGGLPALELVTRTYEISTNAAREAT